MLRTVFLVSLVGRASAGACDPADSCPKLTDGLYCPVNDVTEHANINRDVKQIATYLKESTGPNYAAAKTVYENGLASSKGSTMRTLQALARKDMTGSSGTYANDWYSGSLALANNNINAIWDDWVAGCLDPQPSGFCHGKSDNFRKYIINKCCIGIVMGYTTYEMGAAVAKANAGQTADGQAAYAWDEAAAFWVGNVDPTDGDGYTGPAPKNLYSPYEFAWKRDADFSGLDVHTRSIPIFNQGLVSIRGTYSAAGLTAAQNGIYKMIAITAIRSALKYSYKAAFGSDNNDFEEKYLAEGWAYWRTGAGYIASLSAAAKTKVEEINDLFALTHTSGTLSASITCDVKTKVEDLYGELGIDCEDVGQWSNGAYGTYLSSNNCNTCSAGALSDNIIAGSTDYVDMCKVVTSAGVLQSVPGVTATVVAAVAATCDFV